MRLSALLLYGKSPRAQADLRLSTEAGGSRWEFRHWTAPLSSGKGETVIEEET